MGIVNVVGREIHMTKVETHFNLLVLGAGPGGYVAALRAAQKGLRVGVIEAQALGGTCLNRGCIPTKALVGVAQRYQAVQEAGKLGVKIKEVALDPEGIWTYQTGITSRLRKGVESLFAKRGIALLSGQGKLQDSRTIAVTGPDGLVQEYTGDNLLLATGSIPRVFPGWEVDGQVVVTSDEALNLQEIPESLVVIGGGYIGCEFAGIFATLGSQVTILEGMPEILPMVDREITKRLKSYLKRQGITIKTGVQVEKVWVADGQGQVLTSAGGYQAAKVLISVGRVANSSGFGFAEAGIQINERGEVVVDDQMRTKVPGVYAVGDVVDRPFKLAHVASKQGEIAVENMNGSNQVMDYSAVPSAIFTSPEVAMVGLTEEAAQAQGIEVVTGVYPFTANGMALAIDDNRGFVKVVATPQGKTIGVHILGPHASNLLSEATLAVQLGLPVQEWATVIRAHPTLPETTAEALGAVFGLPVHA